MTTVHDVSHTPLSGLRVAILADGSPEVSGLEEALVDQGVFIQRKHPDSSWQLSHVDVVLVRVRHEEEATVEAQAAERQRIEMVEALAATERVIALVDEPIEALLSPSCEFVLSPFRPTEVLPRILRILAQTRQSTSLSVGNLTLDVPLHRASVGGRSVDLTYHEFELLRTLMEADGAVVSRYELHRRLGGGDIPARRGRHIDIHVHRLRSKLAGLEGARLTTVRNVGYRVTSDPVS